MITDFFITPVLSDCPPKATKEFTELNRHYLSPFIHYLLNPGVS